MRHLNKRMTATAGAALLGLGASLSQAAVCTLDNTPAASLLVPQFQVALDDCGAEGLTTLVSVRNAGADPVVARVNLWTDVARPVTGFPIYLDAYATVDINMADILCNGIVPLTDPDLSGKPPSNLGNPPVQRPECPGPGSGQDYEQVSISAPFLATIRAHHTGQPSPQTGMTKGIDFGDNIARGFVTVDTVNQCSNALPGMGAYEFDLSHENVLLGDFRIIDPQNNFSQGLRAIAIESAPDGFFSGFDQSFYSRFSIGSDSTIDRREPLPSTYFTHVGFGDTRDLPTTNLMVWRESNGDTQSFFPGSWPLPYPLDAEEVVYFGEDNEPVLPPILLPGEPPPSRGLIAWTSQWLSDLELQQLQYGAPSTSNMLYLRLQTLDSFSGQFLWQSWTGTSTFSEGRFSGTSGGFALDDGCSLNGRLVTVSSPGALESNPKDSEGIFVDQFSI